MRSKKPAGIFELKTETMENVGRFAVIRREPAELRSAWTGEGARPYAGGGTKSKSPTLARRAFGSS